MSDTKFEDELRYFQGLIDNDYSPPQYDLSWHLPPSYIDLNIIKAIKMSPRAKLLELPEYRKRAKKECKIIKSRGMVDFVRASIYLRDAIRKSQQVLTAGRGSACASLLFYLLECHSIDPVAWGLDFDFFLPESKPDKMPDLDLEVYNPDFVLLHFDPNYLPIRGSKFDKKHKDLVLRHGSGLYFQKMPVFKFRRDQDPYAAYTHRIAKDLGYYKLDLLTAKFMSGIKSDEQRDRMMTLAMTDAFPWDEFLNKDHYRKSRYQASAGDNDISQVWKQYDLIKSKPPKSINDLAQLLMDMRERYKMKEPHAIAYAFNVCMDLILLIQRRAGNA